MNLPIAQRLLIKLEKLIGENIKRHSKFDYHCQMKLIK